MEAQLRARLEAISREGRDEFVRVVLECDDYELTLMLLDTFRLSSAEAVGLLAQVVALRERGAQEADWLLWHDRVKGHLRRLVRSTSN
jgi:succinate dehydrogenase flavin-adding protein (antitoxin of CptAB toxin-antitoxin module)